MDLADVVDVLGRLRYGAGGTKGKEVAAASRSLPGMRASMPDVQAERFAAGYSHAKAHPTLAQFTVPAASFVHGLLGDSEAVQSQAHAGMNQALLDLANARLR